MSKPRKPKGGRQQLETSTTPPSPSLLQRLVRWLSYIGTGIALASSAIVFLPRVTVVPDGFLDPAKPFPISFIITNTNIIPLHKMNVYFGLCHFVTETPDIHPNIPPPCTKYGPRITKSQWSNHLLTMDERFTITLDDFFLVTAPATFKSADISIIVSYEPWFIPMRREKEFKFMTRPQSNGQLQWFSLPLE